MSTPQEIKVKKIQMEKKINAGIIIYHGSPKMLEPKTVEIKFSLRTENDDPDDITQSQIDHNISYAKIRLFLETVLQNTLVCSARDLDEALLMSTDMENNLMVLPDCGESTLSAALHHKLNSICKQNTFMDEITLYEPSQDITYRFLLTDDELDISLPSGQWLGEMSFWDDPWWERDDCLTFDNVAGNKKEYKNFTDQKAIHEHNSKEVFLSLEKEIAKMFEDDDEEDMAKPVKDADVIRVDFGKN